ncbi:hypothetical protein A3A71_04020 [Candidatus Berkelbacteria bacterium RIFCSPLOWO2_01_FULL_50_28]|uniref:Methylated-DNA-[protein]-cysteine S-methyltransferase DNA binding domain-containing protein n=1 Tax=Candidatus Berkelbacteria bacterium RIFCSPLOWO2_01_FULL_50_28 TaxID=1797471 RepID=A0A1F5EAA3_9BACT|nr:MAG: hypothetical protein A2807_01280 [Candidatus Berkelbacteria bacterium RIFCSPHIGHO2_01_FULL_50_36]OGD63114.1 MAG: hypothetical protein A3F39_01385 [Candidatus Berkelbacteria bacterium RIFCSPHIGHO2_12_FULL_50_11]OGD64305.1 MAG: hypothetical protein A3A71_04020 [Candidatus Berkelbacteria bacterium RIFCSPLOWO2_01_FULL_50_28]
MTFSETVIGIIRNIPRGKVATYGQVAALAGSPRAALMVGRILRYASEREQFTSSPPVPSRVEGVERLPWQRVINSQGRISIINISYPAELQAKLLQEEGVRVTMRSNSYFVDLGEYLVALDRLEFTPKI